MSVTGPELYEKLRHVRVGNPLCTFTKARCFELAPVINEIEFLKKERDALVLAHSYVSGEILYSVADFVGDSYALAVKAQETKKSMIVFAAVDFMAETAKILNPEKRVFKPNRNGGCSLADSITANDVRRLRRENPDHIFVCYINTTAEVKAECDVVVTSSNVLQVIQNIPNNRIFFIPDRLMAQNVQNQLQSLGSAKQLKWSDGTCYVHEEYDGRTIPMLRRQYPGLRVLSHPECHPDVVAQSDFVGSTNQLLDDIAISENTNYFLMTECGLVSRIESEFPNKKFVGSCVLCKYMKGNSLEDILRTLKSPCPSDEIVLKEEVRFRAKKALDKMFYYTNLSVKAERVEEQNDLPEAAQSQPGYA